MVIHCLFLVPALQNILKSTRDLHDYRLGLVLYVIFGDFPVTFIVKISYRNHTKLTMNTQGLRHLCIVNFGDIDLDKPGQVLFNIK